jgi:hypothetical protein
MCDARAGVEEVALGARGRKKSLGSVYQSRAADDKVESKDTDPVTVIILLIGEIQTEYSRT